MWWPVLATAIDAVGVYTAADEPAFRTLVRSYALMEEALDGDLMEPGKGLDAEPHVVSPASVVALVRSVSQLLTRFGLDPASRDKLIPAPSTEPAKLEADPDDFEPIQ